MSTHIRNWGIALIAIGFFAIPGLATQAQTVPSNILAPAPASTPVASPTPTIKILHLKVTAYASVPEETSDHPFITASGEHVADGIVAANFLPFGTQIQIPALFGDKIFTVEDRMNQMFNSRIDIWMPSVDAAVDFGIHNTEVVVLGNDSNNQNSDTDLSLK
jgi:3D (Asp-Asp-Asp) domain-containing protein